MELFVDNQNKLGDINWIPDELGWINCNYIYGNTLQLTNVVAQLDTTYNNTSCFPKY